MGCRPLPIVPPLVPPPSLESSRTSRPQLKPSEPFGLGFAGDNYCWIFLTRESLDKFLLRQPFSPVAANIEVHLSPYTSPQDRTKINQARLREGILILEEKVQGHGSGARGAVRAVGTSAKKVEQYLKGR
jgi:hypothetical protein